MEDDFNSIVIAPLIDQTNVWFSRQQMEISVTIHSSDRNIETRALVDSGAAGVFINKTVVAKYGLKSQKLERPRKVFNVDRTENKGGMIRRKVTTKVTVYGREFNQEFFIAALGVQEVILGYPWLVEANPMIRWTIYSGRNSFGIVRGPRVRSEPRYT